MKTYDQKSSTAQAVPTENQAIFMMLLRNSLRAAAEQMMQEEVEELCGQSHRPEAGAQYRRAGSENGTCHSGGRREAILRPRVRKQVGDGTEREHVLVSYSMMRRPGNNAAAVVTALGAGMSTRSQAWASEGVMSKTAASRHWIEATAANLLATRRASGGSENSRIADALRRRIGFYHVGEKTVYEAVASSFADPASANSRRIARTVLRLREPNPHVNSRCHLKYLPNRLNVKTQSRRSIFSYLIHLPTSSWAGSGWDFGRISIDLQHRSDSRFSTATDSL